MSVVYLDKYTLSNLPADAAVLVNVDKVAVKVNKTITKEYR